MWFLNGREIKVVERLLKLVSFVSYLLCNWEEVDTEQMLCQVLLTFITGDNQTASHDMLYFKLSENNKKLHRKKLSLNTIKIVTQTYPIGKDLSTACPFTYRSLYSLALTSGNVEQKKEIKFNVQELFPDDDHWRRWPFPKNSRAPLEGTKFMRQNRKMTLQKQTRRNYFNEDAWIMKLLLILDWYFPLFSRLQLLNALAFHENSWANIADLIATYIVRWAEKLSFIWAVDKNSYSCDGLVEILWVVFPFIKASSKKSHFSKTSKENFSHRNYLYLETVQCNFRLA